MRYLFYMILLFGLINMSCQNPKQLEYPLSNKAGHISSDVQHVHDANHESLKPFNQFTHVIINDTPYYKEGPQIARLEKGFFKSGIKLRLISDEGSYLFVEAENGIKAHVATSDIKRIDQ